MADDQWLTVNCKKGERCNEYAFPFRIKICQCGQETMIQINQQADILLIKYEYVCDRTNYTHIVNPLMTYYSVNVHNTWGIWKG